MNRLGQIKLILFFTKDVSLCTWDQVGMLEREVEIYRRLLPHLGGIAFLTYGGRSELRYAPRLGGIKILCNRWGLPSRSYAKIAPLLHWWHMGRADIYKTNQIEGAEVALLAKRLFGKKVITRCGYSYSYLTEQQRGPNSVEVRRARALEREVFTSADRVVVTTPAMRHAVLLQYSVPEERVKVIPNYVETDLFQPSPDGRSSSRRICFVGRLAEEKNLFALLEAIKGLDVELVIVGNGALGEKLRMEASTKGISVRFLGNVPNRRLPDIINSAALFVLPSLYEGHPKVILEAMACGQPVIGTNVSGIRELICHRKTGYLCGTSSEEMRAAIREVLADADLQKRMGRNAREFAVEHFDLTQVVELELALLQEMVGE